MRLRFDHDDEDAFNQARVKLLAELRTWGEGRNTTVDGAPDEDPVEYADILLDWRYHYSTGDLDRFTPADIDAYLLEWCPRKLSFPPETWRAVPAGASLWIQFLADTGRWSGGLVQTVLRHLADVEPDFLDAMGNPANFGLAKGLFMGPALGGADIDLDDPDSIQRAMDAFNDLPFEQRAALTDDLVAKLGQSEPIELTLGLQPAPADVEAAAQLAPIIGHLDQAAEWLGEKGRVLTKAGNLKVADARVLVKMWETDDLGGVANPDDTKIRSAVDLRHLDLLLNAAIDAGALRRHNGRLLPVKRWMIRPAAQQIDELLHALVDMGPVWYRSPLYSPADRLVEGGLSHWSIPLLYGDEVDVDSVVEEAVNIIDGQGAWPRWAADNEERQRNLVATDVELCLDVLERCGLVTRTGARVGDGPKPPRGGNRRGGIVAVTPIGRAVLPGLVELGGYRIKSIGDLSQVDADELLRSLDRTGAIVELSTVWESWTPDRKPADKARELVAAIGRADHPTTRLNGFALLDHAGPAAREPVIELFDGPLADHAATFLLDNELLDEEAVIERLGRPPLGPLVDLLAAELDADPEAMVAEWERLTAGDHEIAISVIENLWRVDLPETVEVLEAIGRHVTDKAVGRAARKSAFKRRSSGN